MNLLLIFILVCVRFVEAGDVLRLSPNIKPSHYRLRIETDLDEGVFFGRVQIHVRVSCFSVKSIKLHSANLTILKTTLDDEDVLFNLQPDLEIIDIFSKNTSDIQIGAHRIKIDFKGSLLNKTVGFFKTQFTNDNGTVLSELAVTDFESTYARTAFPCFDEPAFKARFKIGLIVRNASYTALSNMDLNRKFPLSRGWFYKFQTSCRMSSYLVAFAIVPYTFVEKSVVIGCKTVPIRIWSYNVSYNGTEHILRYAGEALRFFAEYLDYGYPMPKIDMIEYDRNLSSATENWGLITAMKNLLHQTEAFDEYQIASVVTHEIAHFWFGNLVTNGWWEDLWLQEAFAEYLSMKVVELILNKTDENYIEDMFIFDQQNETSPIVSVVKSSSDIENQFNDITYFKGAAVLRMLEFVTGEETFKYILRDYIDKFQFQTATTSDFLDIIDKFDEDIKSDLRGFLETYLYQNRYPLISVREDLENGVYELKQRSCAFKKNSEEAAYDYKWTIPITYITNLDQENYNLIWFDKDLDTLIIPKGNETWIKFNYRHFGFYRMNYSESLWENFFNKTQALEAEEKDHILSEAIQLFESEILSCEISLRYIDTLAKNNHIPWPALTLFWYYMESGGIRNDPEAVRIFQDYTKSLAKPEVKRLKKIKNMLNETISESKGVITDKVQVCIKWMKENWDNNDIK